VPSHCERLGEGVCSACSDSAACSEYTLARLGRATSSAGSSGWTEGHARLFVCGVAPSIVCGGTCLHAREIGCERCDHDVHRDGPSERSALSHAREHAVAQPMRFDTAWSCACAAAAPTWRTRRTAILFSRTVPTHGPHGLVSTNIYGVGDPHGPAVPCRAVRVRGCSAPARG
jgi:hypothetical protein